LIDFEHAPSVYARQYSPYLVLAPASQVTGALLNPPVLLVQAFT